MDEREALARLKQGDISGLETLVWLHQMVALKAAFLVCHDESLAQDVVQSAFLRVYERIAQFDTSRPFRPWFCRMVVNATLTAVSRRQTLSLDDQLAESVPLVLEAATSRRLEAAETREALWHALEQLAPGQRAAIVLRYYLDLNDQEIAEKLDLSPSTVRRRLHDARQRLRGLLPGWVRPE